MVSPVAKTPEALTPYAPSLMLHLDRSQASESLNESESLVPVESIAEVSAVNHAGSLATDSLSASPATHDASSRLIVMESPFVSKLKKSIAIEKISSTSTQVLYHPTLEAKNTQVLPSVTAPSDPTQDVSSSQFVPFLGSWAKPLFFTPHATPPDPSTPREYNPAIVGNQLAALWPSLNDEILNKQPKSKHPTRSLQLPIEKLPPPELKADGTLRFPWAARLSPQSRILFRAATPTYRLDGTPELSIPSKVLKLGPENKDEYVIGKFHKVFFASGWTCPCRS